MSRGAWLAAGLVALAGLAIALAILLSESPDRTSRPERVSRTPSEQRSVSPGTLREEPSESRPGSAADTPSRGTPEAGSSREPRPGTAVDRQTPEGDEAARSGSETLSGVSETRRSGNWVLDPEIHQRILETLPEEDQVPYLSVRVMKLATETLRHFPREEREASLEARNRVAALRRRIAERKLDTRGDGGALENLRNDLLRLDDEVELWRERVLAGEPLVPEFVL